MRVIAFFQTLRGKLILTYTAVTVLALLALEVIILSGVFIITRGMGSVTLPYLGDVLSVLPQQARPYLQPDARDLAGLQAWLDATYGAGYASLPPQFTFDNPAAPIVKPEPMYVLAPDRTILAAAPSSVLSQVGQRYQLPQDVLRSQDIVSNALKSIYDPARLSAQRPDGNYLLALPVGINPRERPLLAVVIVTVEAPPADFNQLWPLIIRVVPLTAVCLLCAVAPLGALFGLVMSHGLTKRLRTLTLAADAWSTGDFSVQPHDRARDEINHLAVRMRRMAEHVQALLQSERELALANERNRLARELHDTVKQEIFATLMQVRAAKNLLERDPAAAHQSLDAAEELIKTAQMELGLVIMELRPVALQGQAFANALKDYLATWSQHAHVPAVFEAPHEFHLPVNVEQALFRVAQEALANVARHSHATAVTISLACDARAVTMRVADNGAGFDTATAGRGLGLQSMRERMLAVRGSLDVRSEVGGGVTITASAPLGADELKEQHTT